MYATDQLLENLTGAADLAAARTHRHTLALPLRRAYHICKSALVAPLAVLTRTGAPAPGSQPAARATRPRYSAAVAKRPAKRQPAETATSLCNHSAVAL